MTTYNGEPLCLYKNGENKILTSDLAEALAFIKEGDTILVHSDVKYFGRFGTMDRALFLNALISVFTSAVGSSGNLLAPVFTYSFCKNEVFNVQHSPSAVGVLSEAFRRQEGVVRNLHPIFSIAGRGKSVEKFLAANNDSFGANSAFANLIKGDAWIVFYGIGVEAMTFIHYIEQSYGVPYRYMKRFEGSIINLGTRYDSYADYYVRDLKQNPTLNLEALERRLLSEGVLRVVKLGNGYIKGVKAKDLYDIGVLMLKENIYSFVTIAN
ncbi:MAG: AAC(3) family N-acetyltransferase [Helicobacteraceae bacterium]|jgi:aminoglycoside 3-N-acetyltransferase|nr:AAC(3) family N-acetyltransferase [Helicobacteraceae bacterium]